MQSCPASQVSISRRGPSDDELVHRVRAGDTEQYGALVNRYHRRLFCVALRILKNEADAEDALQDAYILGLTHLDQYAGRSTFFTWIARITINEAFTRIRVRRRSKQLAEAMQVPGAMEEVLPRVRTPEQHAIHRELSRVLNASVQALPEHYRAVFATREMDEMTTVETAATLGISKECVKTRLHRARELLRSRVARRTRCCWSERAA